MTTITSICPVKLPYLECVLRWERVTLGGISITACSLVLGRIFFICLRKPGGRKAIEEVFEKLVGILMVVDIICALLCNVTCFVVANKELALWIFVFRCWLHYIFYAHNFAIAHFITALIIGKHSVRYLQRIFVITLSAILCLSVILTIVLALVLDETALGMEPAKLVFVLEVPAFIFTTIIGFVFLNTWHRIKKEIVGPGVMDAYIRIRTDVFFIAIIFMLRASAQLIFLVSWAHQHQQQHFFWAKFLFFFQRGAKGLCDAVIFGRLFRRRKFSRYESGKLEKSEEGTPANSGEFINNAASSTISYNTLTEKMIYTTTLNIGGCQKIDKMHGEIQHWIPTGYDLYVIGCQECLVLEDLRKVIHTHLGGSRQYVMYGRQIGATAILHGMIALTIFARTKEVENGAFRLLDSSIGKLHNGVDLVVAKVPNKGATGLAVRYYDQVLAFITAHFASDSKGKERKMKRNEDAHRTLSEMVLMGTAEGFDLHFQHSHCILLGDLNYRLRGLTPMEALERTVASSVWEQNQTVSSSAGLGVSWRKIKNESFLLDKGSLSQEKEKPMPKVLSFVALHLENEAAEHMESGTVRPQPKEDEKSAWEWIRGYDELTASRRNNQALSSFYEHPITFPPSFRWQRHTHADDYNNLEKVKSCYTLSIKEGKKAALRCPSYTDRILVHSLPGLHKKLQVLHYDMCDAITVSDHRPVSAQMKLMVDETFQDSHTPLPCVNTTPEGPALPPNLVTMNPLSKSQLQNFNYDLLGACFFNVRVTCVSVDMATTSVQPEIRKLLSRGSLWSLSSRAFSSPIQSPTRKSAMGYHQSSSLDSTRSFGWTQPEPEGAGGIKEIGFLFPIPFEDPFLTHRQLKMMQEASCNVGVGSWEEQECGDLSLEDMQTIHFFDWLKSAEHQDDRSRTFSFTAISRRECGKYMLVKFVGGKSQPLGQGVVPLWKILEGQTDDGSLDKNGIGKGTCRVELSEGGVFRGHAILQIEIVTKTRAP